MDYVKHLTTGAFAFKPTTLGERVAIAVVAVLVGFAAIPLYERAEIGRRMVPVVALMAYGWLVAWVPRFAVAVRTVHGAGSDARVFRGTCFALWKWWPIDFVLAGVVASAMEVLAALPIAAGDDGVGSLVIVVLAYLVVSWFAAHEDARSGRTRSRWLWVADTTLFTMGVFVFAMSFTTLY